MNNEFITYEQALALKELGFNENCFGYFRDNRISGVNRWDRKDWEFHVISNKDITSTTNEIVLSPLYQQAFRWFREKHNIDCYIETKSLTTGNSTYDYTILITEGEESEDGKRWRTYEEAEINCLNKLIEIAKNGV